MIDEIEEALDLNDDETNLILATRVIFFLDVCKATASVFVEKYCRFNSENKTDYAKWRENENEANDEVKWQREVNLNLHW